MRYKILFSLMFSNFIRRNKHRINITWKLKIRKFFKKKLRCKFWNKLWDKNYWRKYIWKKRYNSLIPQIKFEYESPNREILPIVAEINITSKDQIITEKEIKLDLFKQRILRSSYSEIEKMKAINHLQNIEQKLAFL